MKQELASRVAELETVTKEKENTQVSIQLLTFYTCKILILILAYLFLDFFFKA